MDVSWKGRAFRVFDTAGLRRRSRIEDKLEKLSVSDALRAVRFAEVVVLMMDAQHRFEEQDLRLADLIEREGRAIVIGVNKWDLMERAPNQIARLREDADHLLPQVKGAPVVAVSGTARCRPPDGRDRRGACGVNAVIATSQLNRWFEQAPQANPRRRVGGGSSSLHHPDKARPTSWVFARAPTRCRNPTRYLAYSSRALRRRADAGITCARRPTLPPSAREM